MSREAHWAEWQLFAATRHTHLQGLGSRRAVVEILLALKPVTSVVVAVISVVVIIAIEFSLEVALLAVGVKAHLSRQDVLQVVIERCGAYEGERQQCGDRPGDRGGW